MRRILLVAALALVPSIASAAHPFHRTHTWSYRNPYTGSSGWGFSTPNYTYQYGASPRQERINTFQPGFGSYYNGGYYGGFGPGFAPGFAPGFYGGFGGGY